MASPTVPRHDPLDPYIIEGIAYVNKLFNNLPADQAAAILRTVTVLPSQYTPADLRVQQRYAALKRRIAHNIKPPEEEGAP